MLNENTTDKENVKINKQSLYHEISFNTISAKLKKIIIIPACKKHEDKNQNIYLNPPNAQTSRD